jgi:curved DNA-binding protein CbpA
MSAKNNLDLNGIARAFPVGETMLEIWTAGLSGSLRIERGEQKAVVYFSDGKAVYAVSNQRIFRLPTVLLEKNIIDREFLSQYTTAVNDLAFLEDIVSAKRMSKEDAEKLVGELCESIISCALTWNDADWTFSPHSRLKSGIQFEIDVAKLLLLYARGSTGECAAERLRNPNEWFTLAVSSMTGFELRPQEAFVLSRIDSTPLTLEQLVALCGLSREDSIHNIYCLWLGGFLKRCGWQAAFSDNRIAAIKSANLELKKPARPTPPKPEKKPETVTIQPEEPAPAATEPEEFDLEAILSRIEGAINYYEVLGVEPAAKVPAIRKAYFRLAKLLHPDRYHNESKDLLRRVERSFTELAQAHETLKSSESRQNYDIKMRQEERDRERGIVKNTEASRQEDQAAADFERGFELQLEGEFESAIPYLARAVYYAPNNARYHAYYGRALSYDDGQRHKAETELSTAIRLEPDNDSFRLMLAEFFVRFKLVKRAEGELNRLLSRSPGNRKAQALLDSLQLK